MLQAADEAHGSGGFRNSRGITFRTFCIAALLFICMSPPPSAGQTIMSAGSVVSSENSICAIIDTVASANALPVDFFARVIWQESRFQPNVVGPLTRSGEHALGIAQFMPSTASEHNLVEPFNPAAALPKSGEFLAELRNEFGNLGLAAAAYNSGPQRVHDFIHGLRDLPAETRNYVLKVTGHSVDEWARSTEQSKIKLELSSDQASSIRCHEVVTALAKESSDRLAIGVSDLKVPSWCRYLNHPNTSICGPVHEMASIASSQGAELHSHVARFDLHPHDDGPKITGFERNALRARPAHSNPTIQLRKRTGM